MFIRRHQGIYGNIIQIKYNNNNYQDNNNNITDSNNKISFKFKQKMEGKWWH